MQKTIGTTLAALLLSGAAYADGLNLTAVKSAADPLTGLGPDQWRTLAVNIINGRAVIGKPFIYMINASGKDLIAVTCDGKWQLVGPKPFNKDAPNTLPQWKVTLVPTTGFDGYCKNGIVGQSDDGSLYPATLVSVDGTFINASSITFQNSK